MYKYIFFMEVYYIYALKIENTGTEKLLFLCTCEYEKWVKTLAFLSWKYYPYIYTAALSNI